MSEIISGLIGAILGCLGTYFTLRFNYRQLFAEIVSKSRNNWVNIWRDSLAELIAILDVLKENKTKLDSDCSTCSDKKCTNKFDLLVKYNTLKNNILIRLNMNEKLHQEVYLLINKFSYENNDEEYSKNKELLMSVSRSLLKEEWERVKDEAGGKRR